MEIFNSKNNGIITTTSGREGREGMIWHTIQGTKGFNYGKMQYFAGSDSAFAVKEKLRKAKLVIKASLEIKRIKVFCVLIALSNGGICPVRFAIYQDLKSNNNLTPTDKMGEREG